jgi:hypothetical protein
MHQIDGKKVHFWGQLVIFWVQLDEIGPRFWRRSMPHFSPKIIRRHTRQKSGRPTDSKGERFSLQGIRWRFPRDLNQAEVETRIVRLRALWKDHERFCQTIVFLNHETCLHSDIRWLEDTIRFVQDQDPQSPSVPTHAGYSDCDFSPITHAKLNHEISESTWLQRTIKQKGIRRVPIEVQWSPLSLWIADQIRLGISPIKLPPIKELVASVCHENQFDYRFICLAKFLYRIQGDYPQFIEQANPFEAFSLVQSLTSVYPSVPWVMHDHQARLMMQVEDQTLKETIQTIRTISTSLPHDTEMPSEPQIRIPGTFHQALKCYSVKRRDDFIVGDTFNGSGHHMLGLVENFEKRQPDMPLADLDFPGCQQIYDFWRNRPQNLKTGEALSAKHCSSHIGELDRFFRWLHTTPQFSWRRPDDFDLINRKVKRLDSDRRSIQNIELKTFHIEHLALLYKHALPSERLNIVWCLNCAHGAAEIGRVEWGDLFLGQPHPWIKEGLKYPARSNDSWCGLLRPKTDVIGWWWLWPETVQLVKWWRNELQTTLKRDLQSSERMMLSSTGSPLYRDSSRNAQTAFGNQWSRLFKRVEKMEGKNAVPKLPFGKLRDQMSNWLGSDENQAVLASTALAHGIPHKGDKLLYKHYSNRPWAHLFQKQQEFREVLQPMFDQCPNSEAWPLKFDE